MFDLDYAMTLQAHFPDKDLYALVSHISPKALNLAVEKKSLRDTLSMLGRSRYDRIRLIILSIVGEHPLHEVSDTCIECSCRKIELTHSAF